MKHHPAAQPRPAGQGIARTGRRAAALTVTAAAVMAGGPAALAGPRPAPDGGRPTTPPHVTTAAHLPLWAVVAIVTATIVLSVATTLITLSVERMWRTRRSLAATAEPQAETGDILSSRHYPAR